MPAKMVGTAELPRLVYRGRIAVPGRFGVVVSGSGVGRDRGTAASQPLADTAAAGLVTARLGSWVGCWLAICAVTRGGGGFDEQRGVRRRCPALHTFLLM